MIKFETGKTYFMRSPCDHECIWRYTVVSRTAKTLKLKDKLGNTYANFRIKVWNDCEQVLPLGRYSMSPSLTAEHKEAAQCTA